MDRAEITALLKDENARYVNVGLVDLQGQLRAKMLSVDRFLSVLDSGIGWIPLVHMLDFHDIAQIPSALDDPGYGFGDSVCRIDTHEVRTLPWEPADSRLFFFVEFEDGAPGAGYDCRRVYKRALAKACALGLHPKQGLEYEFRLFRETPSSAHAKGYRNLKLITETPCLQSLKEQATHAELLAGLREVMHELRVPISMLHWEHGAGFGEISLDATQGIKAANDGALFKTYAKAYAQRQDLLMSFMARYSADMDGSSSHIHLSLLDRAGQPLFFDPADEQGMSERMRHFVGGLQHLLPELLLMLAPNINSFKRFVPGIFTPLSANWGIDNRTCAIRVLGTSAESKRLECRVPGADANPYLALACVLGAGVWGIEEEIEPSAPVYGNSYKHGGAVTEKERFPANFRDAIRRFEASKIARQLFGDEFVTYFAGFRHRQDQEFSRMVSDLEIERFLELA